MPTIPKRTEQIKTVVIISIILITSIVMIAGMAYWKIEADKLDREILAKMVAIEGDTKPADVKDALHEMQLYLEEITADYQARLGEITSKLDLKTADRYKGEDFKRFHDGEFQELKTNVEQLEAQLKGTE